MVSGENNMISSTQFQSGVLDRNNLNRAYFRVVRNKEAAGIDGMTVDESPAELLERLTKGTYKPNDDLLKLKVKVIVYVLQK
ncbi:hypothetical protein [Lacticaseibacillus paracasei]|nr:hypothetical protein [Lacticaseibacillus paracasei]